MIDGVDKATICAHYDDDGRCRSIFVYLNDARVTTADVASAVRSVFRPESTAWNAVTARNELPRVRVNGTELFDNTNTPPGWF